MDSSLASANFDSLHMTEAMTIIHFHRVILSNMFDHSAKQRHLNWCLSLKGLITQKKRTNRCVRLIFSRPFYYQPNKQSFCNCFMALSTVSEFYLACRNGDIAKVDQLIKMLSIKNINQMEPNGSTALHAASYYGHIEIVRLLLKRGMHRGTRNKFGLTAYDEALNDEIRNLLCRDSRSQRFGGTLNIQDEPEWMVDANRHAAMWVLPPVWGNIRQIDEYIKNGFIPWLNRTLVNDVDKETMSEYIEELMQNGAKSEVLIKMYTEETTFYRKMNQMLASRNAEAMCQEERGDYWAMTVAIQAMGMCDGCCSNDLPDKLYRKVDIAKDKLSTYVVNRQICFPSFTSTTKNRSVLNKFSGNVIFIIELTEKCPIVDGKYEHKNHYYCRDISRLSAFPGEEEILWWPWSPFEITQVCTRWFGPVEIHLKPLSSSLYWDLMDW